MTLPDMQSPELGTATGRVALDLAPSTVAGHSLRRASVKATLSRGTAEVSNLTAESGQTNLHAAGTVAVAEDGDSHLTYAVSAQPRRDRSVGGRIRSGGHGNARGNAHGQSTPVQDERRGIAHQPSIWNDRRSAERAKRLRRGGPGSRRAPGRCLGDTRATFVKAGGQEIRDFTAKARYSGQALDFDSTIDQPSRRVEVRGAAQLREAGAVDVRLDHLLVGTEKMTWSTPQGGPPGELSYAPPQLVVKNLQLGNGGQRLSASGSLRLDEAAALKDGQLATAANAPPTALSMTVEHVDLAQLDDLLAGDRDSRARSTPPRRLWRPWQPCRRSSLTITKGAAQKFDLRRLTAKAHHDGSGAKLDLRLDQLRCVDNLNASLPGLPTLRPMPMTVCAAPSLRI